MHTIFYFCSRNISERFGKVHSLGSSKPPLQSISAFFIHIFMEKDFKIATWYVAIWIFFGLCAVILLQAWGFLPINK